MGEGEGGKENGTALINEGAEAVGVSEGVGEVDGMVGEAVENDHQTGC